MHFHFGCPPLYLLQFVKVLSQARTPILYTKLQNSYPY